jgi:hypothetical protein
MQKPSTIHVDPVIYLAIELSASTWLVVSKIPTCRRSIPWWRARASPWRRPMSPAARQMRFHVESQKESSRPDKLPSRHRS